MGRLVMRSGHCPICNCRRLCAGRTTRHSWHATAAILTFGMSLPVSGVAYSIDQQRKANADGNPARMFRCQTCGSPMTELYE